MPKIDAGPTIQGMDKLLSNVAFGIARGLTQVAKLSADTVTAGLQTTFDRPNPFTMQSVALTPATKDSLVATVFVKDAQAKYLELEETGGTRSPQPGSPINLPVDLATNAYGNIPRGKIANLKARKDVFVANGKGRSVHLPPGIYQRAEVGKRRDGSRGTKGALQSIAGLRTATSLRLLVAFDRHADYAPRFNFEATITDMVQSRASAILEQSINDAIRSMR